VPGVEFTVHWDHERLLVRSDKPPQFCVVTTERDLLEAECFKDGNDFFARQAP
jgi:hypothetical protein